MENSVAMTGIPISALRSFMLIAVIGMLSPRKRDSDDNAGRRRGGSFAIGVRCPQVKLLEAR
jgi:hypothetical protein